MQRRHRLAAYEADAAAERQHREAVIAERRQWRIEQDARDAEAERDAQRRAVAAALERTLEAEQRLAEDERLSRIWPAPSLIRGARDAEEVVARWMPYLGLGRGYVTGPGSDGGIDVFSDTHVAQVKFEALPTGRPTVQALHGVASAEEKIGVFFAAAGYSQPAVEWADRVGLLLYTFDFQGEPTPTNAPAMRLWPGSYM